MDITVSSSTHMIKLKVYLRDSSVGGSQMKLFELQSNLKSYTYPAIKIIICSVIIVLCFMRNSFIRISSPCVEILVAILCCALTLASILCMYISIAELCETFWNRSKPVKQVTEAKNISIEEIIKCVFENDILEIEIIKDGNIERIGSSSDCKYSSSVFFDKRYYINEMEYETIEAFQSTLIASFPKGYIPVLSIDGLQP